MSIVIGNKRAESRARYYTRAEAQRLGWDVQHPANGGAFLEEQELVNYFSQLKTTLGLNRPDFGVLGEDRQLRMVIECKNDVDKLEQAGREAQDYANSINSVKGFDVRLAVGIAGSPDKQVQTRCFYRKGTKWLPLKSHDYELTQLPTLAELASALESDNGTTDVQLPGEAEFFDAAVKISNILRVAKIVEADRPKVIGAIIVALYQGAFTFHPEVVIEQINANVKAAVYSFTDMDHRSREFLVETLQLSTETRSLRPMVADLVNQLERLNVRSIMRSGVDFLGQFYEAFLRYGCDAKSMGIVFTPRHITRFCAELVDIRLGMTVYDPAAGTGGFLVAAFDRIWQQATTPKAKDKAKKSLAGCDTNPTVWALAVLNMFFRGDGKSQIRFKSCFENPQFEDGSFSRVLLNPPFSQVGEPETAFIDHALAKLEPGGELAVVVKTNVMVDARLKEWRQNLITNHHVLAVISLPTELFYPTGAATVILIVKAHSPNVRLGTFLAKIRNDGYVISKKRRIPTDGTQLPEILALYREFLSKGAIPTVMGLARSIDRESISDGGEICAEEWLPSREFTIADFESHRVDLFRQILTAVTQYPEAIDELLVGFDELLAAPPEADRPTGRANLSEWFEIADGNTTGADSYPDGTIPYISSSSRLNGIVRLVQPPDAEVYDTPHIAVTGFGNAFVQPWKFIARGGAGSAVRTLKPRFAMSAGEMAWFAAQINEESWRIFYGRMVSKSRLARFAVDPPPADLPSMRGLELRLREFGSKLDSFSSDVEDREETFRDLSEAWKRDTRLAGSVSKRSIHPAYQQIIGMGESAVPLILRELDEGGVDDWFWALTSITGYNPISEDIAGNMPAMAEAWLQWGRSMGYLSDSQPMTRLSSRNYTKQDTE